MQFSMTNLVVLIVYLVGLTSFGVYLGLKAKNTADLNIGGRTVPGWACALSERATAESAWCLVGFPGYAYVAGIVTIWVALGLFLGNVCAWTLIANKMRREADHYDAQTYVDWIVKRHSKSKSAAWVRLVGSFIVIFLFAFYIEAQLLGGGKTLHVLFGLPVYAGIILTVVVIIPYTVVGGFSSVVYTDCVQSILMIVTLIIAPIFGIFYIAHNPGMYATTIFAAMEKAGPAFLDISGGAKGIYAGFMIASSFAWIIAYLGGLPHLTVRFMAMKDDKAWRQGRNIAIAWTFFGYLGAVLIGLVGLAIFGPNAIPDSEMIMPSVVLKIFPPILGALCVTGAIAAMLSTADSMLIVASSEFTQNILKPSILKGRPLTPKQEMSIARWVTAGVGVLALVLAFALPANMVYSIVSFAWAGMGNPFAAVTCFTLLWDKYTGTAAVWTMICGFVGTIIWQLSPMNAMLDSRLVGIIPALVAGYIATKMTYGHDEVGQK